MDRNAPAQTDLSSATGKKGLQRQLIEQFYEDSVDRYGSGSGSEQARTFSQLLGSDSG